MNIRTIIVSLLILGGAGGAQATEVAAGRDLGIGVALGGPTSIVGKYYLDPDSALDFGLAFGPRWGYRGYSCRDRFDPRCDPYGYRRLGLNADYLWQNTLARSSVQLDWHIGGGARVWFWDDYYGDDLALAARMPLGLDLMFARPNFLEVFLELAPAFYVVPGMALDIEGFVGARFYF
jgi:hypothetical protein